MKNHTKKILSVFAAATMLASSVAFVGCNKTEYKGDKMDGYVSNAIVSSQGGFVVEKGEFVYFINGAEDYTADNTYGNVVKGALMRISKSDLKAKNYNNVKMVVPSLLVSQNTSSGIYIYEDYVYYASPVTDKDKYGVVLNNLLDFKRAKIDGSAAPESKLVRVSTNSVNYRFVEENGKVYCLYEDTVDGAKCLKSYDVDKKETTVLVKGAKSSFFFDTKDLTNPNVYYTMAVTNDIDTDNTNPAKYDQLFSVNAATKVKVDAGKAMYTATLNGATIAQYDFDESFFNKKNQEAKDNKQDEPYDLSNLTSYPYVNLGKLVLDGVGKNCTEDVYNSDGLVSDAFTPDGYNYTISSYQNGGVYFTRKDVNTNNSAMGTGDLYYLSDAAGLADAWDAVKSQNEGLTTVSKNTANASATALFTYVEGSHQYFYVSNNNLYKESIVGEETKTVEMSNKFAGATLWRVDGDYLYYYTTGTNGYKISRIKHTGNADNYDYNILANNKEFQPITVDYVDFANDWYKPEFVSGTDVLLYANSQKVIGTTYDYIYATHIGSNDDIEKANEAYKAVSEYIDEKTNSGDDIRAAMEYYFHTGKTEAYDAVKDLYTDYADQTKVFDDFVAEFTNGNLKLESEFIAMLGGEKAMKKSDADMIAEDWADSLKTRPVVVVDNSWPTETIILVVVAGVVVVAAAVLVPLFIFTKKKKEQKEKEDATVNAYKRKIDTTDDKTIDVYTDAENGQVTVKETEEPAEEVVEETVEEAPVEEVAEEVSEEVVEEAPVVEAPVEETSAPTEE